MNTKMAAASMNTPSNPQNPELACDRPTTDERQSAWQALTA